MGMKALPSFIASTHAPFRFVRSSSLTWSHSVSPLAPTLPPFTALSLSSPHVSLLCSLPPLLRGSLFPLFRRPFLSALSPCLLSPPPTPPHPLPVSVLTPLLSFSDFSSASWWTVRRGEAGCVKKRESSAQPPGSQMAPVRSSYLL